MYEKHYLPRTNRKPGCNHRANWSRGLKCSSKKYSPLSSERFIRECYQTIREQIIPVLYKLFQKIENTEITHNYFMRTINFILKPENGSVERRKKERFEGIRLPSTHQNYSFLFEALRQTRSPNVTSFWAWEYNRVPQSGI